MIAKLSHTLMLVTLIAASPVYGQDDAPANREYQSRALSFYLDGDLFMMQEEYAQAVEAYTHALKYDTTSATIFLSLGEALLKLNQPNKAYHAGRKAFALEPDDPLVHEFMAETAAQNNKLDEAIRYLDMWYGNDHNDLEPLFRKAGVMIQQKRYGEAIDTYLMIYDKDTIQEQVLTRASEIALSIKDYERSFNVFSRLREHKPDDVRILITYAELCVRTNRRELAISAYETISAGGHASPGNRIQLAWLYKQAGRSTDGLKTLMALIDEGHRQWEVMRMSAITASELTDYSSLKKISSLMMQVYPDSADGYTAFAIAASSLEDRAGAIAALEKGRTRAAHDVDVNYLLGRLYYSADRTVEAEELLIVAHELEPRAREIRLILAAAWSDLKRFDESDSLYDLLLEEQDDDATALNNYAYSIAEREIVSKRQLKYAAKMSKKSLKLNKSNSSFLDTYGWIQYRIGKIKRAKKYVAQSLAINEKSAAVLEHMAILLRLEGDEVGARAYDEKATAIRSEN